MNNKSYIQYGIILAAGVALGAAGVFLILRADTAITQAEVAPSAPIERMPGGEHELDWCAEHGIPESSCTICNPQLIASFKSNNDWCVEHSLPESVCRLCNPNLTFAQEPPPVVSPTLQVETSVFFPPNRSECATNNAIIQFASAETASRAGLSFEPALDATESAPVEAPAELSFDETRTHAVTTTVPATVLRWLVEPGQRVTARQEIAEVQSADIAEWKAEYLEAQSVFRLEERNLARADSMHQRKLISAAELEQAGAAAAEARSHLHGAIGLLRTAGLSEDDFSALDQTHEISSRWILRSPADGFLIERKAPLGELLEAGTGLALIGNPSSLWIEAHVREHDLPRFHVGQSVEFTIDGDALGRTAGRIIWVSQFVDPDTRTGTVRARIEGKTADMRANRFGKLLLHEAGDYAAVAVPMDAVQWEGCCNVVFVQEAIDRYRPRKVTLERGDRGYYNITSGVQTGEMVVVRGSYLLKTELKKSSLGAGCCGIDAKS